MSLKLRGGVWHYRKMVNGQTLAFSTKTGDEKLAKEIATIKEAEFLRELHMGDGSRTIKLHEAIDQWLKSKAHAASYKIAKYHIEKFKAITNKALHEVKQIEAQEIVDQRKAVAKLSSISVMVAYWNAFVNWAANHKMRTAPKLPSIKGVKGKLRWLTAEEQQRWLDSVDPKADFPGKNETKTAQRQDNWDLIVGLLDLGCRYHELANMAKRQINLDAGEVTVIRGKGGKTGTLIMTPRLRAMLERRMATVTGCYVFPTKVGKNHTGSWVKSSRRRAGIGDEVSLHSCRHTFATTLLQGGVDVVSVKELLGHADIKSTLVYTHVNPLASARQAAQVLANR